VNPNLNIWLLQIWSYYFPSYGDETETESTSLSPTQKSKLANHVGIHLFNYVYKQITSFVGNKSPISFLNHVCSTFSPGKLIVESVCSLALNIVRSDIKSKPFIVLCFQIPQLLFPLLF
jgi:hypothetical protein